MMAKPDTPFPRHWLYYIFAEDGLLIVAGAVALVLKLFGCGEDAMGQALPKPALRPYARRRIRPCWRRSSLPAIEELTGDDYSEAQQEAWAAAAEDEEAFGKRLAGQLTLIATIQNAPVGFASLKGA